LSKYVEVDYQIAKGVRESNYIPEPSMVENWINRILQELRYADPAQVSIRVVDEKEITQLNDTYRQMHQATNVLAFPYEPFAGVDIPLLGDVVICASVVAEQAREQGKTLEQHWAHMVTHGVLHLLGYDHIEASAAKEMEKIEIGILAKLNYPNPYGDTKLL
jgi:probable rRNA maturation factor